MHKKMGPHACIFSRALDRALDRNFLRAWGPIFLCVPAPPEYNKTISVPRKKKSCRALDDAR